MRDSLRIAGVAVLIVASLAGAQIGAAPAAPQGRAAATPVRRPPLFLSKVDEIGFADLMPGSGHGPGGWVDVAQIEVYARAVPRTGSH